MTSDARTLVQAMQRAIDHLMRAAASSPEGTQRGFVITIGKPSEQNDARIGGAR